MTEIITENITDALLTFIKAEFENYPVDKGLTKIEDHTNALGFGYEVRARGNAKIKTLVEHSGEINRISNIPGLSSPLLATDGLVMVFSFTSWTQAESWTVPGGARVDYPWKNLYPSGKIKYILRTSTTVSLELNNVVFDLANDRPNKFIKNYVAPLFTNKLDNIIETYTDVTVTS